MPWHPKALGLTDGAIALWLRALCWCNAQKTDGAIPAAALRVLGTDAGAAELVASGLWDEADKGWRIHDFGEYQPTAAHRQQVSRAGAARKAMSREATASPRDGLVNASSMPRARHVTSPSPSPSPSPSQISDPPNPPPDPAPPEGTPPAPPVPRKRATKPKTDHGPETEAAWAAYLDGAAKAGKIRMRTDASTKRIERAIATYGPELVRLALAGVWRDEFALRTGKDDVEWTLREPNIQRHADLGRKLRPVVVPLAPSLEDGDAAALVALSLVRGRKTTTDPSGENGARLPPIAAEQSGKQSVAQLPAAVGE